MKKKIILTFQATIDYDKTIDDKDIKRLFRGSLTRAMKYLYKQEGMFFDEPLHLVYAEKVWRKK